jgi:hypothetical protein
MRRTLALLLALTAPLFAQKVGSGMAFLKLGPGADAAGMAESFTAGARGALAGAYNPAGIGALGRAEIVASHAEWIQGVRTEFLGAAVPLDGWSIGAHVLTSTVADIPVREVASDNPLGTFTALDAVVGLTASVPIAENIDAGATLSALLSRIYTDEAHGFSGDLGVRWRVSDSSLTVGAAILNVGSMGPMRTAELNLPTLLRAGASILSRLDDAGAFRLMLNADVSKATRDEIVHLRVGGDSSFAPACRPVSRIGDFRGGSEFGSAGSPSTTRRVRWKNRSASATRSASA